MAGDHDVRFVGDHWAPGKFGLPILSGVTAWAIGRILEVHPVQQNAVIVVGIDDGELGTEDEALVYHERQYQKPVPLPDQAG
jgi:flavin reductase (DIM6/NTAB) family NADH-FMN oxidoreductase RutF